MKKLTKERIIYHPTKELPMESNYGSRESIGNRKEKNPTIERKIGVRRLPTQAYETKKIYHEFEGTGIYKAKSLWVKHADGTRSKDAKESELRKIFGGIYIEFAKRVRKQKFLPVIPGASKES